MCRSAILIMTVVLAACVKNDTKPTYIPISSQTLRDAVTLKARSYFIYQDSASGRIDSFYVSSDAMKSVAHWDYDNTDNEQQFYNLHCPTGPLLDQIGIVTNRSWVSVALIGGAKTQSGLGIFEPFTTGTVSWSGPTAFATGIAHHRRLSVGGISYDDVYEVESFNTQTPDRRMRTWFSGSTGLIKYRLQDSGLTVSASLLRCRLVK